jgi:DNA-directed RNA polymerase specialized sigma24 family protein
MSYRNSYEGIDTDIVKMVKRAAFKAVGKAGIRKEDVPDIEQELMIAALAGLRKFESEKSRRLYFLKMLIENRLADILKYFSSPKRATQYNCVSLNEQVIIDDEASELIDLLNDDFEIVRDGTVNENLIFLKIGLPLEVRLAIDSLLPSHRKICRELEHCSCHETAGNLKHSKKGLKKKICKIRKYFKKLGLGELLAHKKEN